MKIWLRVWGVVLAVLLILALGACDSRAPKNEYIDYIQSNQLTFKVTKGPVEGAGFVMQDDGGKRTDSLYAASTHFQVDKLGEEKIFDIKANRGGRENGDFYTFYILIEFDYSDIEDIKKLIAWDSSWRDNTCIDSGEPLSLYLKIVNNDNKKIIFEKMESHTCKSAITKNKAYKRIARVNLEPGWHTIQIRNELASLAFKKYTLSFLVMHEY